MIKSLGILLSLVSLLYSVSAQDIFHRNLAYGTPFSESPELSVLKTVRKRHSHLTKRATQENTFNDNHYPSFYGADWSNSPHVWKSGITFSHSVASGDPLDTSVILWTRAAPKEGPSPDVWVPICVSWKILLASGGNDDPIHQGEAFTSYDVDWTVKVEATNLSPDTKYIYQFFDCTNPDNSSPVGSTRTLPSPDTEPSDINGGNSLKFAVFSCSQYQTGYFNAYGVAAHTLEPDFFIHLGDYIYEYIDGGEDIGRTVDGRELSTIFDYRQRMAQYRSDQYLLDAHEKGPWIAVWDDHELADNTWKAGTANSDDNPGSGCGFTDSGVCFTDRKFAAVRAYHEWMPIRQIDLNDKFRIWRNFQFGKLLDLTMLDTRMYDRDITDIYSNTLYVDSVADYNNRSMMGFSQEQWLFDTLDESVSRGSVWRVIGQQVVFTQISYAGFYNLDQWDGYRANRARIYDHLYGKNIDNVVVLAGDSHANWVSDLSRPNDTDSYDPKTGEGAIGVEFAGTAVSSTSPFGAGIGPILADPISAILVSINDDLQWNEVSYRGFYTLTVNAEQMNATYYAMKDVSTANLDNFVSAQFIVKAGENKLSRPVAGGSVEAGVLKSSLPWNDRLPDTTPKFNNSGIE